ncbi:MAG TPA: MoaD/ThiS family protein [Terriglobales bacterium]|nr:MoaD/ThiS family protein [Terriglobales bacterium]
MSIQVHIPTPLRKHTSGAGQISSTASSLPELLGQLGQSYPDLQRHICDEQGQLRRFLNVYVNEEDIRFLGGSDYRFRDGDEVLLIPSIAGGTLG